MYRTVGGRRARDEYGATNAELDALARRGRFGWGQYMGNAYKRYYKSDLQPIKDRIERQRREREAAAAAARAAAEAKERALEAEHGGKEGLAAWRAEEARRRAEEARRERERRAAERRAREKRERAAFADARLFTLRMNTGLLAAGCAQPCRPVKILQYFFQIERAALVQLRAGCSFLR